MWDAGRTRGKKRMEGGERGERGVKEGWRNKEGRDAVRSS